MADDINLMDYMDGSDWLGVALAAVAAFFVGFVWFTLIFGKRWAKEMDMEMGGDQSMKGMAVPMIKDIVGNFLTAYILFHVTVVFIPSYWADHFGVEAANAATWGYGIWAGLFIWLGFYVPVALSRTGWEGRSWAWFGIDVSYNLVKLMVMAQIILALASIP